MYDCVKTVKFYIKEFISKLYLKTKVCTAERVLTTTCQILCDRYRKFWRALASTHSGEPVNLRYMYSFNIKYTPVDTSVDSTIGVITGTFVVATIIPDLSLAVLFAIVHTDVWNEQRNVFQTKNIQLKYKRFTNIFASFLKCLICIFVP